MSMSDKDLMLRLKEIAVELSNYAQEKDISINITCFDGYAKAEADDYEYIKLNTSDSGRFEYRPSGSVSEWGEVELNQIQFNKVPTSSNKN